MKYGYWIVEKQNRLAVHGHFDTLLRAKRHLVTVIPDYVKRGFFMNKTLNQDSFEIIGAKHE